MKALVAYYSLEGSTRKVARQIAEELSADLLEIQPVKEFPKTAGWKFVMGGFHTVMNLPCPIKKLDKDPKDYDLLIIGTPVWAFRPAPPVATFLKELGKTNQKMALFCTHQGSPGATLKNMESLTTGQSVIATLDIHTGKDEAGKIPETVNDWVQGVLKPALGGLAGDASSV